MRDRWIWLADDGELEGLRGTLQAAGLQVEREPIPAGFLGSSQPVLLGSPARIADLCARSPGALSVAVLASDELEPALALDAWVRRPLHPFALVTLLEALAHPGGERRWAQRVAIGAPTRGWTRHGFRRATLVDLSACGARLLCETPVKVGARMLVWLPRAPGFRWPRRVSGRVLRCEPNAWERPTPHAIALSFTGVPLAARRRLQALLHHHAGARLSPARPRSVAAPSVLRDRRVHERHTYDRRVIAHRQEGPVVLRARDLSVAGLRIEPADGLAVGSPLALAIQVKSGTTPLVVKGRVARDDGEAGMSVLFDDLDAQRKDVLVKMLEELADGGVQVELEPLPG